VTRFGWLRRRRPCDDDLQEEIRAHLAIAADERVADGADRDSARLSSLKDFGNVTLATEAARSVWTPWWVDALRDLAGDVRHAIRVLAKHPGFSLTVVAVLSLGIGLNAAVFTLLKSLALTPISGVAGSAGLNVILNETSGGRQDTLSYPHYQFVRDHDRAFVGLFGTRNIDVNLGSGSRAEPITGEMVTGNYFEQLGVRAQLGRTLLPSDEVAPGQHPVVVLSDTLWKRHFGSDPDVVGKTIRLNAYPMTVVGVAAPSFHGTIVSFDVEVFVPIMMTPQLLRTTSDPQKALSDSQVSFVQVLGRLRPGTTRAEASSQMAVLSTQLRGDATIDAVAQQLTVVPIWRSPFGAQTYMLPAVTVLSAMAALLLLIVCANITALVLARGISRRGEIALRLALGASRTRIVRFLLVEHLALAIPGALIAIALVPLVMPAMFSAMAAAAPMRVFFNLSVDRLVIGFSVLAACASALLFGLLPALRSSSVDLLSVMKEDLSPRGAAKGRLRMGLVVSQVAVSLLLLVGAGLVTRSLDAAQNVDPGFDGANVISTPIDVAPMGYNETRGRALFAQLLESVGADTATESATLALQPPLTMVDFGNRQVTIDGYTPRRDEDLTFLSNVVAPNYFRTLRIRIVAGREFESRDDMAAGPVVMVNETLARRFWRDPMEAIGKRLRVASDEWRTVIGVARDIKYSRVNEAARPYVYLPFLQAYQPSMMLHARGSAGVDALTAHVRAQIQRLDPELPMLEVRTLSEAVRGNLVILEMAAAGLFIFGVAGMALAGMGIYGLVSYTVRQSTHEIGIRMALGAQGTEIVWHFLRGGLRVGTIGAAAGTVAALILARLLGSVLYGVSATDPPSFASALAVVLGGVIVATIIPAWRAARTSPLSALRQ
jgi:predicted permease